MFLVATLWSVDFDLIEVIDSKRLLQMHLTAASLRQMTHEEKFLSLDRALRRTAVMCSLHPAAEASALDRPSPGFLTDGE